MKNLSEKFRKLADSMEPAIQAKIDSGTSKQNPTPRRIRMAEAMERDGRVMQSIQLALRRLADLHDQGQVPALLAEIRNRAQLEDLRVTWVRDPKSEMGKALSELFSAEAPVSPVELQIRKAERDLVGRKIPGFFWTQPPVVEQMIDLADIRPGNRVLEPSAGKGDLADAARRCGANVDCVEINHSLREILELKGLAVIHDNFMQLPIEPVYDRVLMNPPFEKGQDIEHILRAWQFLKPGGVLVAIAGEGAFHRQGAKEQGFRYFLERNGATEFKLNNGEFKRSGTGVSSRIIALTKPAQAAPPPSPTETFLAPSFTLNEGSQGELGIHFEQLPDEGLLRIQAAIATKEFHQPMPLGEARGGLFSESGQISLFE